jgi:hypothetical protein
MHGSDADSNSDEGDGMQICHGCLMKGKYYKAYHTIHLCPKCANAQRNKQGQFKKADPDSNKKALQEDIVQMLNKPLEWRKNLLAIQSEDKLERTRGLEMAAISNHIKNKPIFDLHKFYVYF